ncbi:DNA helicase-2 / ATP-dependent DNA helicase PcrA [[Clostridium] fimetarium]|uniref:DNA 3'-5' helicase n=2 Tax=[Clostridium] fimetarium TaxID=99656 RepID=A0A1I0NFN8_9FIRM|nr:DNA helicase-2 / ATP-dependent DNA helicase PcrA [[Clostridium] fimetarium]
MRLNGCVISMIINSKTIVDINLDYKIEAGPGAGKTQFLVNHINNVLQNSDKLGCTRKIACITYTNTAVGTILKRLGKGISNKVEVSTIHSFLYSNVVKPYCSFLPVEYDVCVAKIKGHDDPFVNHKYVSNWLEKDSWDKLKHPNTKNQLLNMPTLNKALQNWLLSMKCNIENDKMFFVCDNSKAKSYDKKTGKLIGINGLNLKILQEDLLEYKKLHWQKGKLDHEDILFFSYILIKMYPFILTVLRAKFPYFYIDEFQDTSPIQSFLIEEIRKSESTIGVIGDNAQAIYGFQGASVSLFTNFKVNPMNMHTMLENHRSSNQIIAFLNSIRKDINQQPSENIDDMDVSILIGDRNKVYSEAVSVCNKQSVVSLARDNITSNAMKDELEGNEFDRKLIEKYSEQDSNGDRKKYIIPFIQAIELAKNIKYKEAIKKIDWIFRTEENPQKQALYSLSCMLKRYHQYDKGSLMDFYNVLCNALNVKLAGFKKGSIKDFYENNPYRYMAICVNVVEDTSNHITIHKAKGAEYKNVFVIGNKDMLNLLLKPDLENNEEQRIYYVAMSRAQTKLFIQFDSLNEADEKKIKKLYNVNVKRIENTAE